VRNIILLILFTVFSSCVTTNIESIKEEVLCPVQYTFNRSYMQVWQATVRAIAQEEVIKTISQDAGIIVTEYGTIEDREVGIIGTIFLGKTYKYSFTINLLKRNPAKTDVRIKTNLKGSQAAIYEREEKIPKVESYMRKDLFIRICNQLYPGQDQRCNSLFSKNLPHQTKKISNVKKSENPQSSVEKTSSSEVPQVLENKTNTIIFQVQKTLTALGYTPGPIDGMMGGKTQRAIRQFQKDAKIKVTGAPDQNTLIAMGLKEGVVQHIPAQTGNKSEAGKDKEMISKSEEFIQNVQPEQPNVGKNAAKKTEIGKAKVIETTSLLSEPSFMAESITKVPRGQLIKLLEKKDEFYKIRYKGMDGYIYAEFVTLL